MRSFASAVRRRPSSSFVVLRRPSSSFGVLRRPSASFVVLRRPSLSFVECALSWFFRVVWCLVFGVWCLVFGVWCLVLFVAVVVCCCCCCCRNSPARLATLPTPLSTHHTTPPLCAPFHFADRGHTREVERRCDLSVEWRCEVVDVETSATRPGRTTER